MVFHPAPADPRSNQDETFQLSLSPLFAWLLFCSLIAFWGSFSLPYALDDIDMLQDLGQMRAGRMSFGSWLFLPHNEHVLPLLRLLFWGATWICGLDASAARAAVFLIHVMGALACAVLASHVTRGRAASWIAGTIYAGAAGFSGSVIWEITIAQFSISAMFLTAALAVLAGPFQYRKAAFPASLALIVASCAGMPGAFAAAAAVPAYVWLARPKLAIGRWRAIAGYLLLQALVLFATMIYLSQRKDVAPIHPKLSGLLGGLWVTYTAPFRFLASWTGAPDPGVAQAAVWSIAAWAVFAISFRVVNKSTRRLLMALWAGDAVFALLIGLGRSDFTLLEFFYTDRYYYYFLLPLAIQAGAAGAQLLSWLRTRFPRADLVLACGAIAVFVAAFAGSRAKMRTAVPWRTYQLHRTALIRAKALAQVIAAGASAASNDILLADGFVPLAGVHKGGMLLSNLFFVEFPRGRPRLKWSFGDSGIPIQDALLENQILDLWSNAAGIPPPVCVVDGILHIARAPSSIDFKTDSFRSDIVTGFHVWDGSYYWMTRSGTVRLRATGGDVLTIRAYAPLNLLRKKWPEITAFHVAVQVDQTPIGELAITSSVEQEFRLPLPVSPRAGQSVTVALTSELVWRGVEVGLLDERELSMALVAIGFSQPLGQVQSAASCVAPGE